MEFLRFSMEPCTTITIIIIFQNWCVISNANYLVTTLLLEYSLDDQRVTVVNFFLLSKDFPLNS